MPKVKALVCLALAVAIGYLYVACSLWATAFAYPLNPVGDLLLSLGLTGTAFRVAIWPSELLINIVVALPAAFLLLALRPRPLLLYALVASIPIFLHVSARFAEPSVVFFTVIAAQLPAIPLAAWVLRRVTLGPNNSFKPKPLRGSA